MARRTVALCDGKYIGIELIYTVVDGKQINIPDMLKNLRMKSRSNELYCPCGCGVNLILVAGDKNLREQHFREKTGTGDNNCAVPIEGKTSVDSKIVLKCWLDHKLNVVDIESRVPIDTLENTMRKTEFTFLSREKKLAIRYWRTRLNIVNDKLDVLNDNVSEIKVIYIVDVSNGGTDGQYPEALMKLQDKQGFCLLLEIKETEYNEASLNAVFYEKDLDGLWKQIVFAKGKLNEFDIENNNLFFAGNTLENLLTIAKQKFSKEQQIEQDRRAMEEKLRIELMQRFQEEQKQSLLQKQSQNEYFEELQRLEIENLQIEKSQREVDFRHMESNFIQQETQVRDVEGNRWIKCEFCGKVAKESTFFSYGGKGRINLGTCKECFTNNNPVVKEKVNQEISIFRKKFNPTICPDCGGKLKERSGKYGKFYGCINYPRCTFSRPITR